MAIRSISRWALAHGFLAIGIADKSSHALACGLSAARDWATALAGEPWASAQRLILGGFEENQPTRASVRFESGT